MKLSSEDALNLVYDELEDWQKIESHIVGHSRWSVQHEGIYQYMPTGKFYKFKWSVGATEYQDESPFQYEDEVEPIEVQPTFVTVQKWETV